MKIVIIAVVILSVAAFSFWTGGRYGKDSGDEREILYYVDPMTPGFRSDNPGIAPCGMPLEPVYAEADEGQKDMSMGAARPAPGTVKVSPARQQLIGVKIATVEEKPMTYFLRLYGRVVPDETKIYLINSSTDCWIRKVSDVTTGSIVKKNQILAEALAPAYYNAQLTYLIALDNIDRIRQQLGGQLRHQQADLANNQIRVAVQALQNLGVTDAQTEELANKRQARPYLQVRAPTRGVVLSRKVTLNQWFKASEEFYTIADIGRVWVYADVYENEAMHLRPGMTVEVVHAQMGKTFTASVSPVLPLFDPTAKTLKVRLDMDNPGYDLRPDMFVDVRIPITMPPSVNVPADAVIDSGTKTIVYVDMGKGNFEPRSVKTGWRLGRQVEITGGLMPGEKVIISGNFLIDSESRMKTAASGTEVEISQDPVCGRYVDDREAEIFERIATYANETFCFCSEQCKRVFEKEPETYAQKNQRNRNKADRTVGSETGPDIDHAWADLPEHTGGSQAIKKGGAKSAMGKKDSLGKYPTSPEVIDWDGPEKNGAPPRDWRGWGDFPGAEYLGLKHKTRNRSVQPSDVVEAGPEPDDDDAKMKHEIQ